MKYLYKAQQMQAIPLNGVQGFKLITVEMIRASPYVANLKNLHRCYPDALQDVSHFLLKSEVQMPVLHIDHRSMSSTSLLCSICEGS